MGVLIILCILLVFYVLINNFYWKRRKLPPGPAPLPFLGNLFTIIREPPGEDCYIRWAKKYGPVYTYWMGELPIVCVADYTKMVETFVKDGDAYAGRYSFKDLDEFTKGKCLGIANTNGEFWREQRRFALRVFRDFGLGKNLMQDKILNELNTRFNKLDNDLEDINLNEHDIPELIELTIASIINSLLFGISFKGESLSDFYHLKPLMDRAFELFAHPLYGISGWNPKFFIHLPYFRTVIYEVRYIFDEFFKYFDKQIEKQIVQIELDYCDEPSTNYVEAFLKEKIKRDSYVTTHNFSIDQLKHSCFDLWSAGQDTTSNTLIWGLAYLLHNPHCIIKLQQEIDSLLAADENIDGRNVVLISDRANLPYTNAVISECQRIANLAPQNLLHRTMRNVNIDGYVIPEGTCIVPQMSVLLYNDKIYENPRKFNPERFLKNGIFMKSEELIPFSIGKRQCLGESLARMELFLIITNLFYRYNLSAGKELPSLQRCPGITVACPHFKCKIEKRQNRISTHV